jgi:hypothetical protein
MQEKRASDQFNEFSEKAEQKSSSFAVKDHDELIDLYKFYQNIPDNEKVLMLVGGGTAALTYLYTQEIEPLYTHIIILGDRGYWDVASHRLGQPHHILALPHCPSDLFVDPAEHDESKGILPHESRSAYVHSQDFQARLTELEKTTLEALNKQGRKVFIARTARVKKIDRLEVGVFSLEIDRVSSPILANKVIVASGAGPARTLSPDLENLEEAKDMKTATFSPQVQERILNYTDILTPTVEKARNKDIFVYGGGATAAWAMEVADRIGKPLAWVAKNGFKEAVDTGSRVNAIIKRSREIQIEGGIENISYQNEPAPVGGKILVKVQTMNSAGSCCYRVDYLFNCIGQDVYEQNGIPEIISPDIQRKLFPYLDKNYVTGSDQRSMLGWSTNDGDLLIIGAAHATYYNRDHQFPIQLPSVSQFLPRSGQVPITIGGVISSVCALTNYMPLSQDPETGEITLTSLNVHVMNATQLAAYFTAFYPEASATQVNNAVESFVAERAQTEFGLSTTRLLKFLHNHFGKQEQESAEICEEKQVPDDSHKEKKQNGNFKQTTQKQNLFSHPVAGGIEQTQGKINHKISNVNGS